MQGCKNHGGCTASPADAKKTKWDCYLTNHHSLQQKDMEINWGHTAGDAKWACDKWVQSCTNGGGCDAYPAGSPAPVQKTKWDCYRDNTLQQRNVEIDWGHGAGDAKWACDQWVQGCKNGGGCQARPAQ